MPHILIHNLMERFHDDGSVYMRMNNHFVHMGKFRVNKLAIWLDCQTIDIPRDWKCQIIIEN